MTPEQRTFDVITFDCYGTLVDWRTGIVDAFRQVAADQELHVEPEQILRHYHDEEPKVQAGHYRPYREILAKVEQRVLKRLGWEIGADQSGFLANTLPQWPPFEDTVGALNRLAESGFRLGILSNIDNDLLSETCKLLPDVFDPRYVVTAEHVGSYKPGHSHFEVTRLRIGSLRWLHAAQSFFHDIIPTDALGIPNAWVNRLGESQADYGSIAPTIEAANLNELADFLAHRP